VIWESPESPESQQGKGQTWGAGEQAKSCSMGSQSKGMIAGQVKGIKVTTQELEWQSGCDQGIWMKGGKPHQSPLATPPPPPLTRMCCGPLSRHQQCADQAR